MGEVGGDNKVGQGRKGRQLLKGANGRGRDCRRAQMPEGADAEVREKPDGDRREKPDGEGGRESGRREGRTARSAGGQTARAREVRRREELTAEGRRGGAALEGAVDEER